MTHSSRTSPDAARVRIRGLDLMRAAAILMVVIYHYPNPNHWLWLRVLSHFGWMGVDLFFVLSGYLIANQLFGIIKKSGTVSIPKFYLRRFFRTLPNYFTVLTALIVLPKLSGEPIEPLWRYLSFTQNFGIPKAFSDSWSLCAEEHFYLVFPWFVLFFLKKGNIHRFMIFFVCILGFEIALRSYIWFHHRPDLFYGTNTDRSFEIYLGNLYYPTYVRLDGLLFGISIAACKRFQPQLWSTAMAYSNRLTVVGLFALGLSAAIVHHRVFFVSSAFGFSLLALSFSLLTVASLDPKSFLGKINLPGIQTIALLSYAIYLVHVPAMEVAYRICEKIGLDAKGWAMAVVSTISIYFFSKALFEIVEKPFLKMRDRIVIDR